jgi:hypothetical protein
MNIFRFQISDFRNLKFFILRIFQALSPRYYFYSKYLNRGAKSELYKKEQEEFSNKIIEILDLPKTNIITLYELDNDKEKQEKIIELIPYIRKYFSFNSIKAVGEPHRIKRPWLSIIKQITKLKYTITAKDHRIKMCDKVERTILYRLFFLCENT